MERRNKKAFTIIELIVVIAILGILVLLGMNNFTGNVKNAKHTKVMVATKTIEDASGMYHMDNNDWPRLTDEPYTKEQLEAFAIKFYDNTGKEITLDPEGNYYDIDYDKLSQYAKAPENKKDYILQNPVGKIFYMENLNEAGENRVDYVAKKQVNSSVPSSPTVSDVTENSVIVTGQDGTEVKLNDGEWFNSPHTFTGLNEDIEYTVYARFKITASKLPSIPSEGVKFTTQSGGLYNFTTHTFTNAGQTGNTGPNQSQLNNAYKGSQVEGQVTSNNGIQLWTVPKSGRYRIEAYGSKGGGSNGGLGAIMKGDFNFKKGEIINILVGQTGRDGAESGGGGGTFVYENPLSHNPLIAAGGGGGGLGANSYGNAGPGINASSTAVVLSRIGGSTNGRANVAGEGAGWGGAGWRSNSTGGTSTAGSAPYVYAPRNGGQGHYNGGFGGGHSTSWSSNAGAGGGYTGGIGAYSANGARGSGGGSFNSGTNQENSVGNVGHGKVIITYIGQ